MLCICMENVNVVPKSTSKITSSLMHTFWPLNSSCIVYVCILVYKALRGLWHHDNAGGFLIEWKVIIKSQLQPWLIVKSNFSQCDTHTRTQLPMLLIPNFDSACSQVGKFNTGCYMLLHRLSHFLSTHTKTHRHNEWR